MDERIMNMLATEDYLEVAFRLDKESNFNMTDEQLRQLTAQLQNTSERLKFEAQQQQEEYQEMLYEQYAYYANSRGIR